jgi:hypothetical protein
MRLDVFSNDFDVSLELRRYAEARVWPAADHVGGRWVGIRFIGLNGDDGSPRVACQVDVWLRRLGLVTVRHTDTNPFVAVDCAAIRLRQAIARKIAMSAPTPTRGIPCPDQLAEAAWENEGGRRKSESKPATGFPKYQTRRRHRHVDSQHLRQFARHATAGQRTSARHAEKRFSGFRSHPPRLART